MADTLTQQDCVLSPNARVLVYNYKHRGTVADDGRNPVSKTDFTNESVKGEIDTNLEIISKGDIVSIETSRQKSRPDGTFQIVLAPTKNWVSTLTVGSWLVIMMSTTEFPDWANERADAKYVKMIGKISDVRVHVGVSENGARITTYIVSGEDWGAIFNATLSRYSAMVDESSAVRMNGAVATNIAQILKDVVGGLYHNVRLAVRPKTLIAGILAVFGGPSTALKLKDGSITALANTKLTYNLPAALKRYIRGGIGAQIVATNSSDVKVSMGDPLGAGENQMMTFTHVIGGVLKRDQAPRRSVFPNGVYPAMVLPGEYSGQPQSNDYIEPKIAECRIYPSPKLFDGITTAWEAFSALKVDALNEMYTELDLWNCAYVDMKGGNKEILALPFTLVVRPRPFILRDNPFNLNNGKYSGRTVYTSGGKNETTWAPQMFEWADNWVSYFKYLRRVPIDTSHILSINAGASLHEKLNMVDIVANQSTPHTDSGNSTRGQQWQRSQTFDATSIERDGLRYRAWNLDFVSPPDPDQTDLNPPTEPVEPAFSRSPSSVSPAQEVPEAEDQPAAAGPTTFTLQKNIKRNRFFGGQKPKRKLPPSKATPPELAQFLEPGRSELPEKRTKPALALTLSETQEVTVTKPAPAAAKKKPAKQKRQQEVKGKLVPNTGSPKHMGIATKKGIDYWNIIYSWKYLIREWYFDAHRTLSGTVEFVGHDWPFMVGTNIILESRALGYSENYLSSQPPYFLAHIENVSHHFSVDAKGARSYVTAVQFVRGVFVDKDGNPSPGADGGDASSNEYGYGMLDTPNPGTPANNNVTKG